MPLIEVKVLENVFSSEQKKEMIEKLTDTMIELEGEHMRGVTLVTVEEVASGSWGFGGTARSRPRTSRRSRPAPPSHERPAGGGALSVASRRRTTDMNKHATSATTPLLGPTVAAAARSGCTAGLYCFGCCAGLMLALFALRRAGMP